MRRRTFLSLPLAAAVPPRPETAFEEIAAGYLRNLRRTSPSGAVCDFTDGTILKGALARSGKTYDSVSRMLPAIAACLAGGRAPALGLGRVLLDTYRNAFDPESPDYWEASPADRQDQRQVESSIVAWSLWLARDQLLPQLTSRQRRNVQDWLASCTRVPVRRNNWAWFTAVNQAARLALAPRWKEFSGDAQWMLDDLAALDRMAAPGDGWYSDSPGHPVYDYYNFWVFASHFLYWNRMAGRRYPEWVARFSERLRRFLQTAPYFFGANGSHVLFGRSLIYRWAVLTPLVLAYQRGLWPHSAGLLRRIVSGNIAYFWNAGAFDHERGKLRETLSMEGTAAIHESYIDNGHPYWGMQAFAFLELPRRDPFWTAAEEPLPVERGDFLVRLEGTWMVLAGTRASGQVRWLQALSANASPDYRDKYNKFSYSSHFPFNIDKRLDRCARDSALVFRLPETGAEAGRSGVTRGSLTPDGIETDWWAELAGARIEVRTTVRLDGEFERRVHEIRGLPPGAEVVEGSAALGLGAAESPAAAVDGRSVLLRAASGHAVASWNAGGYERPEVEAISGTNLIWPRSAVAILRARAQAGPLRLASVHYASPHPLSDSELAAAVKRLY